MSEDLVEIRETETDFYYLNNSHGDESDIDVLIFSFHHDNGRRKPTKLRLSEIREFINAIEHVNEFGKKKGKFNLSYGYCIPTTNTPSKVLEEKQVEDKRDNYIYYPAGKQCGVCKEDVENKIGLYVSPGCFIHDSCINEFQDMILEKLQDEGFFEKSL